MKLTTSTLAVALATTVTAQFTVESPPFHLVLSSDNSTINNSTLSACHTGAAIESLCLSNSVSISPSDFHFNTTNNTLPPPNATIGETGLLTWWLPTADMDIPSAMTLYTDPITNVALPLLFPGSNDAQLVAFDEEDRLNIQGYVDYAASPPGAGETKAYYRWYACETYYTGYTYVNLAWVLGPGEPENPTCVQVEVKRVFI